MRTTIDKAGRIVVPKALREAMGLTEGQEVEIAYVDGRIEIDVPSRDFDIEMRGRVPVAVSDEPMPTLTADTVRDVLEEVRR
ncbi:AbrB/MazE/SpoVT family DNA-binding domain-containing protein [Nocardioides dilutus]